MARPRRARYIPETSRMRQIGNITRATRGKSALVVGERFLGLTPTSSPAPQEPASYPYPEHRHADVPGSSSHDRSEAENHSHTAEVLSLHEQHTPRLRHPQNLSGAALAGDRGRLGVRMPECSGTFPEASPPNSRRVGIGILLRTARGELRRRFEAPSAGEGEEPVARADARGSFVGAAAARS